MMLLNVFRLIPLCLLVSLSGLMPLAAAEEEQEKKVSFYNDIRPIFQAHCHGCHQPAKDNGAYIMTDFSKLTAGGESEEHAIVPGKPDESYLVGQIVPVDGVADMPKGKKALAESQIDLIQRWIAEGAEDDTPAGAKEVYSVDSPPIYTRPPVITSLDFSPDGSLLAIAGFHEVLLTSSDGKELIARLIGVSERIESVKFSPDGSKLLVTGGLPARMGEIQVWDVASQKLDLSLPITFDTVYGGSWSPDGNLIAFGCADNTVRAISAKTGEQVLFQGAHNDWVRDTVFSKDGSHLISVGRDMTSKLTEVKTERFVDNITSITPGILKGGVNAVARHPERDEIVVGGADGQAKVYRVFRLTVRRIGDDANLIRRMPKMKGRVFGVAVSPDGKRIAAVSSLDGSGQVDVYSYEFDTGLPNDIKKINEKTVQGRSAAEKAKLEEFRNKDVKRIAQAEFPETGLYSLAFSNDGSHVAVAGSDGVVRLIDAATGEVKNEFSPAPITEPTKLAQAFKPAPSLYLDEATKAKEQLPTGSQLLELQVEPREIVLNSAFDYAQILVTGKLSTGDQVDVTRMARFQPTAEIVTVSPSGFVAAASDGQAELNIQVGETTKSIPVKVNGFGQAKEASFIHDVAPTLSRLGCNQGTCHGAAQGKNGFKLSLRGYDAIFDVRAFTDDLASRRTNLASPDDSLMLLKATAAVPHVGGQLVRPGEPYYQVIRDWIASGASLDLSAPRVVSISVLPHNPVIQNIGGRQQIRVVASYSDGRQRDVTREAFITSGNTEIAEVDRVGVMSSLRRGEAPVLARFEGAYAATTLTVMGNREGFAWRQPDTWGPIDQFVASKWERMKIQPSELTTDAEFIRRIYLDLTGLPPTADEVRKFLADDRESRVKRDELIDKLIGTDDFVEYWTNKWADLLQVNRKFLGAEGAAAFRDWIKQEVQNNTPYDQFVRKIITASGSNKENPAASYYKILRNPEDIMENTTHLFLGVRFNCNKCHDHPFERWTQDQYYETAAYFARVNLKADPASGNRRIGGTAVEGAKPFYEIVSEAEKGEVTHNRTGQVTSPRFPYDCNYESAGEMNRREELASWITSPDNEYFAKSYVNRLWGYLLGVGIMEPIDDIRAGNPPTNPELIDYLTRQFIDSGFDVRHVMTLICKSRTYQLSVATNRWNSDDSLNYSHAMARRLPAEVLYDAIYRVTGAKSKIPGVPDGTRAASIPDAGIKLPDGFLTNLGRPPRESACECERINDLQLGPVMALISGPTVATAIGDAENAFAKLVREQANDARLINEIFLRILNRPARAEEIAAALDAMDAIEQDHVSLTKQLAERDTWWKDRKPVLEKDRLKAIAEAKADLEAFEKKVAPKIAEDKKKQAEKVAQLEADLKKYKDELPKHIAAWEKKYASNVEWFVLAPESVTATGGVKLARQADRSVLASGKADRSTYTIVVNTSLTDIQGLRVEALPVAGKKGGGPGVPDNGNFVVTEFEVQAASKSKPKEFKKVELHKAKSNYIQAGFNVALTTDGNKGNQNAWAIANAGGTVHWATFESKQPFGGKEGTVLKLVIHQNHNAKEHLLARFRISVTRGKDIGLSLPEDLQAIVKTPADQRDDTQKQFFSTYFGKTDKQLIDKTTAVATAKRPLPEEPGITKRKATLTAVSKEVPEDSRLVQLRADMEYSKQQLKDKRLTVAQDLAWALINTPAFLFNR